MPSEASGDELREILHELNNRLFVVRMSAASLAEAVGPDGSEETMHRIVAIASAAEEADGLVKQLDAVLKGSAGG